MGLLLCGAGCRTAPAPAADRDDTRVRELGARISALEAQAKTADLDDEILALQVERAGLLVTYTPEHPAILRIEHGIRALEEARVEDRRARRDRMLRKLETERQSLLVTYTPDHDLVRRLDAQIAFLETHAG